MAILIHAGAVRSEMKEKVALISKLEAEVGTYKQTSENLQSKHDSAIERAATVSAKLKVFSSIITIAFVPNIFTGAILSLTSLLTFAFYAGYGE